MPDSGRVGRQRTGRQRTGRPPTVLIASHHDASSGSLESILGPNGYTVLKAYTGKQTLERARSEQPDVIIIDAVLPDQDGLRVCRELRRDPNLTPRTPIVIISSEHATRQQRTDALRAGAWEYFGQPLDAEHLLLQVEAFTRAKLDADRAREEGLLDQGTGLYNLRGLAQRARELASQASRLNAGVACVVLAPDFNGENPAPDITEDAMEAAVGRVAAAFKAAARVSDVVGRVGPTEFAVVTCTTDGPGAVRLAERLARAAEGIGDPRHGATPRFRVRAGYHVVPGSGVRSTDTAEAVLRAATALRASRSDPAGSWIRAFPNDTP